MRAIFTRFALRSDICSENRDDPNGTFFHIETWLHHGHNFAVDHCSETSGEQRAFEELDVHSQNFAIAIG